MTPGLGEIGRQPTELDGFGEADVVRIGHRVGHRGDGFVHLDEIRSQMQHHRRLGPPGMDPPQSSFGGAGPTGGAGGEERLQAEASTQFTCRHLDQRRIAAVRIEEQQPSCGGVAAIDDPMSTMVSNRVDGRSHIVPGGSAACSSDLV